MDLDVNIDRGRLGGLHDALLLASQDEARVRRALEKENGTHRRRRREELREAWIVYHRRMSQLHGALSEEHRVKAALLVGEDDPQQASQRAAS